MSELVHHCCQSSVFLQTVYPAVVQHHQLPTFRTVEREAVLADPLQAALTEAVAAGEAVGVSEEVHTHGTS